MGRGLTYSKGESASGLIKTVTVEVSPINEETYDADIAGGKEYESTLSTQINLTEKLSALERKRSKLDTALEKAKTEKEYNNILARTMSNMEQQLALQRKINANESDRERPIYLRRRDKKRRRRAKSKRYSESRPGYWGCIYRPRKIRCFR